LNSDGCGAHCFFEELDLHRPRHLEAILAGRRQLERAVAAIAARALMRKTSLVAYLDISRRGPAASGTSERRDDDQPGP